MECALELVDPDECLGHGSLVHRCGQDLAAAAASARVLPPALEEVGNLRCVVVLLIFEGQPSHRVLLLLLGLFGLGL